MKKEKKEFTNPFSEDFLLYWQAWKDFKKEEFNFEYKGITSEQMAVIHLVQLSDGEEEKAVKILCQSVRRKWQGFWPLKETTHGTKQPVTKKQPSGTDSLEDDAANVLNKRNEQRGQSDYGSNLKAV